MQIDLKNWGKLVNKWALPLYSKKVREKYRFIICKGGSGSGKSVAIHQYLLYIAMTEPNRRIMVARKFATTIRNSCFALFTELISQYGLSDMFKINNTEMTITCKHNNSVIFHLGVDDEEKLKSIKTDLIFLEEITEFDEEELDQLDLRLRGKDGKIRQIIAAFNPISYGHWIRGKFFNGNEYFSANGFNDVYSSLKKTITVDDTVYDSHILCVETTYKHNRFLDAQYIASLQNMKTENKYKYQIYVLNQWGTTGDSYFDSDRLNQRLEEIMDKPRIHGYFTYKEINGKIEDSSIKFIETETKSMVRIYKKPKMDTPYVIPGDTSGEGSDYFACHVLDNTTGEEVAVFHMDDLDEGDFTKQVYCLGKYYNYALIALEINYSTYPVRELKRLGYINQFRRRIEDKTYDQYKDSYGFHTNKLTRPIILAQLQEYIKYNVHLINDRETIEEMLTFIRLPSGKVAADNGCHDDLVISLGIGVYDAVRRQQRMTRGKKKIWNAKKKSNRNQRSGY